MKIYRLNRLFGGTPPRCLDVAVDHGMTGDAGNFVGLENLERAVHQIAAAEPDAIQLTGGQAHILQSIPGRNRPALVLRVDFTNVYNADPASPVKYDQLVEHAVEQAVRVDAACVVVNLLDVPDAPQVRSDGVRNILRLKEDCERAGMPLMVEPLAMRRSSTGVLGVDGDTDAIVGLARQATELGADIIKADPTDDMSQYHRVVEASRVPVLVRGGGRVPDTEVLQRTHMVMQQGAAGIVYGRNIVQHPDPVGMTRALMAMVHEDATPEDAARHLSARD